MERVSGLKGQTGLRWGAGGTWSTVGASDSFWRKSAHLVTYLPSPPSGNTPAANFVTVHPAL